ncbi:MAG: CDP-alcohol phosphatidyltransferase family protein [Candidatus Brennerbacteria bacterium]|nr:CDP-alcohol phosphatidyltransferase family protein [Candidatus Brennerbacteria bacterium]
MNSNNGMFWRKYSDPFLAGTLLKLIPYGVTPNQISWLRILSWPVVFYFLFVESYAWGLVIFFLSALTDAIDGAMARTRNQITELGKFLDPIADRGLIFAAGIVLIPRLFGSPLLFYIVLLEIFQALMAARARRKLGYNPGSNWMGAIRMFIQSAAFIMICIGLLFPTPGFTSAAGLLLYVSLPLTFIAAFLYK